jgi:preprotein translocase subunit SecY
MWHKFQQIWELKEVRVKLIFVLAILVVYRLVAHIPIPGVNLENVRQILASNQILGLLNVFSGGSIQNFSVIMLGVGPYITASIIIQLLTMILPSMEELSQEGESGQNKLNNYTRWLTVPLALLQSFATVKYLSSSSLPIVTDLSPVRLVTIMLTITAGTMFLVWLGELITEKKVGNGTSLLIFSGIVASLPGSLRNAFLNYTSSDFTTFVLFGGLAVLTIVAVVFVNEGQRNIPVTYAKQVRGTRMQNGSSTHLPFRVNMAGVVPIIFALSLITLPAILAQFFVHASAPWLAAFATKVVNAFQNTGTIYNIAYFALIFAFTYFYSAVIFHPQKIAENLQKQGGFIPGIRPGKETEQYLGATMNRLNLVGAVFLGAIAVLPLVVQNLAGTQNLRIGGTSLLIAVAVAIETAKQVDAQITMHEYDRV